MAAPTARLSPRRLPETRAAPVNFGRTSSSAPAVASISAPRMRRDGRSPAPVDAVIIGPDETKFRGAVLPAGLKEAGCPLTFGTNADGEPIGLGVTGAPPAQEFIAYALANIDDDPDYDCWSLASFERRTKDGKVVPAGEPLHEKSDF